MDFAILNNPRPKALKIHKGGKVEPIKPTINDLFINAARIEFTAAPAHLRAIDGGGDYEPPYIKGIIPAMLTAYNHNGAPVAVIPVSIRVETGCIDLNAAADTSGGCLDLILCNPAQTDFEP